MEEALRERDETRATLDEQIATFQEQLKETESKMASVSIRSLELVAIMFWSNLVRL